mgnify:CR=1 FL=1
MKTARFLLCAAAISVAGAAHAQGDARARAEVPFKEGVALHDKGKDAEALKKFEEAYAIFQSPNILFNVARMEQVLGNGVGALKHYRACLKDTTLTEANRRAAEEHTRNLEKNVGRTIPIRNTRGRCPGAKHRAGAGFAGSSPA